MVLNFSNGLGHILGEDTRRKFAIFDPARGEKGMLVIQRNGEVCEVDVAQLLKLVADKGAEKRNVES
jgi:hypothetical protein